MHSADSFSIFPAVKYISHPLNFYSHINYDIVDYIPFFE